LLQGRTPSVHFLVSEKEQDLDLLRGAFLVVRLWLAQHPFPSTASPKEQPVMLSSIRSGRSAGCLKYYSTDREIMR
jgi:hypothetical protein